MGVFSKFDAEAYPHWYEGTLVVGVLVGGIPQDPKIVESWIRTKLRDTRSDAEIQELIASTMAERGISEDDAIVKAAGSLVGVNSFKRDARGLHIEGRQLKAALKEAAMVAVNAGKISAEKWGKPDNATYKKGIKGWLPEHIFVVEETLYIYKEGKPDPVTEVDGTIQKFIHTHRGDSIGYEQYVRDAEIRFTVKTDHELTEKQWGMIWLTGELQGLGASRSQEYGRYEVTKWERIPPPKGK